jgi:hypothetical protein
MLFKNLFRNISWFKVAYGFIILAMFLLLLQYYFQINAGGHSWKTGDWLINYSGGFIRRGLMGSFALFISNLLLVNVKWIIFFIQAFVFICFVYLVLKEFYKFNSESTLVLWLLNPSFAFIFWLNDPSVAFRKEILIYLTLVFFLNALKGDFISYAWLILGYVAFGIAGFSHEAIVFFLPAFLFPFYDYYSRFPNARYTLIKLVIPVLFLTFAVILVAKLFTGSEHHMDAICRSLDPFNLRSDICEGAISWLQRDAKFAHQEVVDFGPKVWINYFILLILSVAPFLLFKPDRNLFLFYSSTILAIGPLFYLASDHGRWISMIVTSCLLTTLWLRPLVFKNSLKGYGFYGFCFVFIWALPNCGKELPGLGLLSQIFLGMVNL